MIFLYLSLFFQIVFLFGFLYVAKKQISIITKTERLLANRKRLPADSVVSCQDCVFSAKGRKMLPADSVVSCQDCIFSVKGYCALNYHYNTKNCSDFVRPRIQLSKCIHVNLVEIKNKRLKNFVGYQYVCADCGTLIKENLDEEKGGEV